MKRIATAVLMSVFSAFAAAHSDGMKGMDMKAMDNSSKTSETTHQAAGTVRSVDAATGTVSVAHGPVASMNWPAMTMTFKARDKKMVEALKPGQKIEIDFHQQGRDYVITRVR